MILPTGFTAGAVAAGLKPSGGLDVGVIASDRIAAAAGIFTTNRVKAAPVRYSERAVATGSARAIVVNAGNANACTGPDGHEVARAMADRAAAKLGVEDPVLVASTGVIGVPMPRAQVLDGIDAACAERSASGLDPFARAIMTTDTRPKIVSARAGDATVVGVAKGAGMIAPEMATMLAFVLTDAAVDAPHLRASLARASAGSFNMISVDGCMSTNDCVLALANGASGWRALPGTDEAREIDDAVAAVCAGLARMIVEDGEGATKVLAVTVEGAGSGADARAAAASIAGSVLLRCAVHGADPNWGRVLAALGTAPVAFDPDAVDVWVGGEKLCEAGGPGPGSRARAAERMREREVEIVVRMNEGDATATLLTNDLSADYIRINAEYTT